MKRMDGNQTQVARFLGISRQTLTRYLKLRQEQETAVGSGGRKDTYPPYTGEE